MIERIIHLTQTFIAGALVLPLFVACSSSGQEDQSGSTKTPPVSIEVMVVQPEELEHKIEVTGSVMANESVELKTETSGRVVKLLFEEGERVQKGNLLAKINDRDLQAQLRKLNLQDSLLSREENRKRQLLEIKAISTEEYEQIQTQLETVRADQDVVATEIDRTDVRAPFSGIVGLRYVSEGAYVDPSMVIATMQQVDPIKIEFAVPEKYRTYLKDGTQVKFTVTGVDSTFKATVYAVEARIDPVTRSVTARARCSNPDGVLFPGAFASLELILENIEDALLVPAEAVLPELTGQTVFIIKNGKAESVDVKTGIRTERRTQLTSGVQPGDTLAVTGLLQLRDGSDVNIQTTTP